MTGVINGSWIGELSRGLFGTAARVTSTLLSLAFGILGARLLGPEEFGKFVAIQVAAGLVGVAMSLGLPAVLGREIAIARGSGEGSVGAVLHLMIALMVLVVVVALTAFAVSIDAVASVLALAAASFLAACAAAVHAGYERVILVNWVAGVCGPLFAIGWLYAHVQVGAADQWAALSASIAGQLLVLSLFVACAKPAWFVRAWKELQIPRGISRQHLDVARTGFMVGSGQLLIQALTQIDIILLTLFASAKEAAQYYAVSRAALFVTYYFGVSSTLAEPTFARLLAGGEYSELQRAVSKVANVSFIVTLVAAAGTAVAGQYYLDLYGPEFREAYPALLISALGFVAFTAFGPAQSVLRANRGDAAIVILTSIALLVCSLSAVLLIPVFGIKGAAAATAVQFFVYGLLLSVQVAKRTGVLTVARLVR